MSQKLDTSPAVIGIEIGKNSFHIVGQNRRGAIVLRQKWSRGQVEARLANLPPCRIGTGRQERSKKLSDCATLLAKLVAVQRLFTAKFSETRALEFSTDDQRTQADWWLIRVMVLLGEPAKAEQLLATLENLCLENTTTSSTPLRINGSRALRSAPLPNHAASRGDKRPFTALEKLSVSFGSF